MADEAALNPAPPRPRLPDKFKECIQRLWDGRHIGEEALLVEKWLNRTDANQSQNRFYISSTDRVRNIFIELLNYHQKYQLKVIYGDLLQNVKEIDVPIIEPNLEMSSVGLRKTVRYSFNPENPPKAIYELCSSWDRMQRKYNLKRDDFVQLWALRVGGNFLLVLDKIDPVQVKIRRKNPYKLPAQ